MWNTKQPTRKNSTFGNTKENNLKLAFTNQFEGIKVWTYPLPQPIYPQNHSISFQQDKPDYNNGAHREPLDNKNLKENT